MSTYDENISTKFFGLNKIDVKTYFSSLAKEHDKMLNDLLEEVKRLKREEEKLLAELMETKKEEIIYEDEVVGDSEIPNDIVYDAHKRVEKTTALINMLADEEVAQLAKKASEKLAEYDSIIERIQEEIEENKEKIETLLADILKLLKSNIEDKPINNIDKTNEKKDAIKSVISNKNEVELFKEKAAESKIALENANKERITADGTSLNDIQKLLTFRKKYATKPEDNQEIEELEKKLIKKEAPRNEIYDIINKFIGKDEFDDNEFSGNEFERQFEGRMNIVDDSMVKENDDNTAEIAYKSEDEIKKKRNGLILGKIAGEDLLDSYNIVIVAKGKTLTEQDIELAEKESKLPELIINMALPK